MFDFSYSTYGKHYNRCMNYPVKVTGKMKSTFLIKDDMILSDQFKEIKEKMIESVRKLGREDAKKYWLNEYGYEDEEIGQETIKISNTHEATKWSDLDDY